jgi:hypothetical protein
MAKLKDIRFNGLKRIMASNVVYRAGQKRTHQSALVSALNLAVISILAYFNRGTEQDYKDFYDRKHKLCEAYKSFADSESGLKTEPVSMKGPQTNHLTHPKTRRKLVEILNKFRTSDVEFVRISTNGDSSVGGSVVNIKGWDYLESEEYLSALLARAAAAIYFILCVFQTYVKPGSASAGDRGLDIDLINKDWLDQKVEGAVEDLLDRGLGYSIYPALAMEEQVFKNILLREIILNFLPNLSEINGTVAFCNELYFGIVEQNKVQFSVSERDARFRLTAVSHFALRDYLSRQFDTFFTNDKLVLSHKLKDSVTALIAAETKPYLEDALKLMESKDKQIINDTISRFGALVSSTNTLHPFSIKYITKMLDLDKQKLTKNLKSLINTLKPDDRNVSAAKDPVDHFSFQDYLAALVIPAREVKQIKSFSDTEITPSKRIIIGDKVGVQTDNKAVSDISFWLNTMSVEGLIKIESVQQATSMYNKAFVDALIDAKDAELQRQLTGLERQLAKTKPNAQLVNRLVAEITVLLSMPISLPVSHIPISIDSLHAAILYYHPNKLASYSISRVKPTTRGLISNEEDSDLVWKAEQSKQNSSKKTIDMILPIFSDFSAQKALPLSDTLDTFSPNVYDNTGRLDGYRASMTYPTKNYQFFRPNVPYADYISKSLLSILGIVNSDLMFSSISRVFIDQLQGKALDRIDRHQEWPDNLMSVIQLAEYMHRPAELFNKAESGDEVHGLINWLENLALAELIGEQRAEASCNLSSYIPNDPTTKSSFFKQTQYTLADKKVINTLKLIIRALILMGLTTNEKYELVASFRPSELPELAQAKKDYGQFSDEDTSLIDLMHVPVETTDLDTRSELPSIDSGDDGPFDTDESEQED